MCELLAQVYRCFRFALLELIHSVVEMSCQQTFLLLLAVAGSSTALYIHPGSHQYEVERLDDDLKNVTRREVDPAGDGLDFKDYPTFEEIKNHLKKLAEDYPELVNLTSRGKSVEGRELYMLKIGHENKNASVAQRRLHAREWISPVTVLYLVDKLINEFKNNTGSVYTQVDWIVMPMTNPDGYEFTKTNRMWRKNRANPRVSAKSGESCSGVDLNRNFGGDVGYGVGGSSDPCSDTYKGPSPDSEPEVVAIRDAILENVHKVNTALMFHSYGGRWLTSWGYLTETPDDIDDLMDWGKRAAKALESYRGTKYQVATASGGLYIAGWFS